MKEAGDGRNSDGEKSDDSDPFQLGPVIEKIMGGTTRRTKFRKIIQKHANPQRTRFESWREFLQGLDSGGKARDGVRRGKVKGKRGRKPKNKKSQLDGGDIISDSQFKLCNMQVERASCQDEARDITDCAVGMGFINSQDREQVWKIFSEWELRDRECNRNKCGESGIGDKSSG